MHNYASPVGRSLSDTGNWGTVGNVVTIEVHAHLPADLRG
jgi:hypothetical protein